LPDFPEKQGKCKKSNDNPQKKQWLLEMIQRTEIQTFTDVLPSK